MSKKLCLTCSRELSDEPGDSLDCGGDCWACVRAAEGRTDDPNVRVFRVTRAGREVHQIAVQWPLPHWMVKAVKLCSADAYVHWKTRAAEHTPNTGIKAGEPLTVVICGDGEISVRYYDGDMKDIWQTDAMAFDAETGKVSKIT